MVWVLADSRRTAGQSSAAGTNDIVRAPSALTVTAAPAVAPDLVAQDIAFEPGTVTVGGMTLVIFSFANTGTGASSASQAAVRNTPASATDAGSATSGSVPIPELAGSG